LSLAELNIDQFASKVKTAEVDRREGWIQAHYKCFANESLNGEREVSKEFRTPALNER